MNISQRIKELREERGLSIDALAEKVSISSRMIYYWETGKYDPKAYLIIRLADFFDVSADYLLGRKDF